MRIIIKEFMKDEKRYIYYKKRLNSKWVYIQKTEYSFYKEKSVTTEKWLEEDLEL